MPYDVTVLTRKGKPTYSVYPVRRSFNIVPQGMNLYLESLARHYHYSSHLVIRQPRKNKIINWLKTEKK